MRIIKGFFILVLCFAAGEVYVRVADRIGVTQVEVLEPESRSVLKEDRRFSPDEDVRVLLIGDSMLAGLGVRSEELFSTILERRLRELLPGKKVRVLDAMTWGFNTYRSWQVFDRMMKRDVKPTVIFYDYSLDDVDGGYPELKDVPPEEWRAPPKTRTELFLASAERLALRHSMLMRYLIPRTRLYLQKKGIVSRHSPMGHLLHDAYQPDYIGWQATRKYMRDMAIRSRQNGVRFMVHHAPDLMLLPDDPFADVSKIVETFCRENRIEWLDSTPVFKGYSARELTISPLDAHPNALAHRILAEFAAKSIRNEPQETAGSVFKQ